ncbi:MAG: DUF2500 family protein [Clostridia bacterium]|nr:DUF2500 family protein [Clostridia bacterium]
MNVILPLLMSAAGIAILAFSVYSIAKTKRDIENYDKDHPDTEPYELTAVEATVCQKRICGEHVGPSKLPKYATIYEMTFVTEDGSKVSYNVSEELYESTPEGKAGTLVTQNGEFFDFGDGEDIPE